MLDQDESDVPAAASEGERRTKTVTVVLSVVGLAIALSIAFFPSAFKGVSSYDDEGSFLVVIRQFMHHGSLYVHTHGPYGPFWFSLAGILFKLTGHDPTLTSGRIIVLVFTALSASMFAAAVWKLTSQPAVQPAVRDRHVHHSHSRRRHRADASRNHDRARALGARLCDHELRDGAGDRRAGGDRRDGRRARDDEDQRRHPRGGA